MTFSSGLTGIAGGLHMSLIAFSTVFVVIAFLMVMIISLHKICYSLWLHKENAKVADKPAEYESAENNEELIAVITAAVMQYAGADAKVISFRPTPVRAPQKSAWRNFGRLQNFERNI